MKIFVLNGHKYYPYAQGKLNMTLFDEIVKILQEDGHELKTTIVENGENGETTYNVDEEIEKYKWAECIIYQSPLNWFSVPWILKKYFDDVFQHGIFYTGSKDYGRGGLFNGKKYMFSMTCNSPAYAFDNINEFYDGKSPDELIVALHKLHEFCAMTPVKSYFAYDVVHNPDIERYQKELRNHINTFVLNKYIS